MFGLGSLLDLGGGGDVNAGNIGDTPPAQPTNFGQGQNAAQDSGGGSGGGSDPAGMAFNAEATDATNWSNQGVSESNQAANTARGINAAGGNGIVSGLVQLFDPAARQEASAQRGLARGQAQAGVDSANRAVSQFNEDNPIQRTKLEQGYAGRGLGQSSIDQEGMQYFDDSSMRTAAQLDQNVNLATLSQYLTASEISASYAQPYFNLIGGILNLF